MATNEPPGGEMMKRMLLNDNKAGMEGLNKERINQIIHEASKGSKFFENEKIKEEQMKKRIAEQQRKVDIISEVQLQHGLIMADQMLTDLEQQRDLSRTIVHTDMDAFYAAVEMRDKPELRDKPMAVGGNAMLSTSNYHARKYGVRAAMPGFIGRKLCPELIIVPLNFDKYTTVSKQVRDIFADYDANFCPMSLDEAYLDITDHLTHRHMLPVSQRSVICRDTDNVDSKALCCCELTEVVRKHGFDEINQADRNNLNLPAIFSEMNAETKDASVDSVDDNESVETTRYGDTIHGSVDSVDDNESVETTRYGDTIHGSVDSVDDNESVETTRYGDTIHGSVDSVDDNESVETTRYGDTIHGSVSTSGIDKQKVTKTSDIISRRTTPVCPHCKKEFPPFTVKTFGYSDQDAVNELRTRIEQKTQLTASAGIAPNMMLAKVCSDKNKPNGQYKIPASKQHVLEFIKDLPTRKISGIGKVSEAMLNAVGVFTCTDLYEKRALLYHLYSSISFNYFMRICLGIGSTSVERDSERKSMSTERTFSEINKPAELYQKCDELSECLAADLQQEQLKGKTVSIKIKTVKFEVKTRAHTLRDHTNNKDAISRAARDLLRTEVQVLAPQPLRLRLMGVRMSSLLHESMCKKQNTIIGAFQKASEKAGSKLNYISTDCEPVCEKSKGCEKSQCDNDDWRNHNMADANKHGSDYIDHVTSESCNVDEVCSDSLACETRKVNVSELKDTEKVSDLSDGIDQCLTMETAGYILDNDKLVKNGTTKSFLSDKLITESGSCDTKLSEKTICDKLETRRNRSGLVRTPVSKRRKRGRNTDVKQMNTYDCPICNRQVHCVGLAEFNEHVDHCLEIQCEPGRQTETRNKTRAENVMQDTEMSEASVEDLNNKGRVCEVQVAEYSTLAPTSDCNYASNAGVGQTTELCLEKCTVEGQHHDLPDCTEGIKESVEDVSLEHKLIQDETSDAMVDCDGNFCPETNDGKPQLEDDKIYPGGINEDNISDVGSNDHVSKQDVADVNHEGAEATLIEGLSDQDRVCDTTSKEDREVRIMDEGTDSHDKSLKEDDTCKVFEKMCEDTHIHSEQICDRDNAACDTSHVSDEFQGPDSDNKDEEDIESVHDNCASENMKDEVNADFCGEGSEDISARTRSDITGTSSTMDVDKHSEVSICDNNISDGNGGSEFTEEQKERHNAHTILPSSSEAHEDTVTEILSEVSVDEGSEALLVCPICNIEQRAASLAEFNDHVDVCLSRGTIREILREQSNLKRPGMTSQSPSLSQPIKKRKTSMPSKKSACRTIASFFQEK